ncbi:hypothetical protein [Methylotenera sp.]|uniref:hypothetical protein n=1 Tax=Methylotenera sp. TaxID=2051956 RepID=UPI0024883EE7|nr:hypothetical protein [Methylotenera sp.]MDI1362543.1 hypothetical protein [Methylotenera sp.]
MKTITLETINQHTETEVLTQIFKHLYKQNAQSTDGDICVYRNDEGQSCAAGCLFSDEMYQASVNDRLESYNSLNSFKAQEPIENPGAADFEGNAFTSVAGAFNAGLDLEQRIPQRMINLISATQHVHDSAYDDDAIAFRGALIAGFTDISTDFQIPLDLPKLIAEVENEHTSV